MRKFLTFIVVLAIIVIGGGWYAKHAVNNVIGTQVTTALKTPVIQHQVNQALGTTKVQSLVKKYASQDTGGLSFPTEQAAVTYALSKLTPSEEISLLKDYTNRNALTPSTEKQIATQVLSQFSPQELAAFAKTFLAAQKSAK